MQHFDEVHKLLIGPHTAEQTKRLLTSKLNLDSVAVSGLSRVTRLPSRIFVSAGELKEVIDPWVSQVLSCMIKALEDAPVELVTDIIEQGLTITGGGALHYGLAKRLSQILQINVQTAKNPLQAVAIGNRKILDSRELRTILASGS